MKHVHVLTDAVTEEVAEQYATVLHNGGAGIF